MKINGTSPENEYRINTSAAPRHQLDEEKTQQRKTVYVGNALNPGESQDPMDDRRTLGQKMAMKVVHDAFKLDSGIDDSISEMKQHREDLTNQIREIDADKEWGAKYELLKDELGQFIYWEGSTVEMKDIDVTIDGDTANATYLLTNGEDELMTEVELVYEDGQWHINNWLQIGMMALDVQDNMDEYIQENK